MFSKFAEQHSYYRNKNNYSLLIFQKNVEKQKGNSRSQKSAKKGKKEEIRRHDLKFANKRNGWTHLNPFSPTIVPST